MRKRVRLTVFGVVQGVGFRPHVYKLALKHQLCGNVLNNAQGVIIDIEGEDAALSDFESEMLSCLPPLAKIDTLERAFLALRHESGFDILKSDQSDQKFAMIPPDIAFCDACKADMDDPNSRYHDYFFTTCTHCGPRYSIIETVPYDRINTSMQFFKMCDSCESEYGDPLSRRYHAQPISCPSCGPILSLYAKNGKCIATGENAIKICATLIQKNNIVAIKGLGGFHLACSAINASVIEKMRRQKNRPTKPFAVMFKDVRQIKMAAKLTAEEQVMIASKEKPIVLVEKIKYNRLQKPSFKICDCVAPLTHKIGVFLPYTPIQYQLFKYLKYPIIATSANLGSEPVITSSKQLIEKLGHIVEYYLDYNREIVNANDDSVLQMIDHRPIMMRLARGYAPWSMKSPYHVAKPILAVGANQKNTIALALFDRLILSPHIGDLNTLEAFEYFTRTIETFKKFYDFKPQLIVCDKHPQYETTKWAKSQSCEVLEVQHHYAHILACMLEHALDEKVLAFSWDGTGYGDDGTIWGGEVFIADTTGFTRHMKLKSFKLLGGEKAIKEPSRVGLALLFERFGIDAILSLDIPTVEAFSHDQIRALYQMWEKEIHAPKTTSMGRLFDGVASLGGFAQSVSYDGESGLLLEAYYDANELGAFDFDINADEIDFSPMIDQIVEIMGMKMIKRKKKRLIASRFINMLVEIIVRLSNENAPLPVVFTGGVFQNKSLLTLALKRLEEAKIVTYFQHQTPINDGGIAFGQLLAGIKFLENRTL